MMRWFFSGKSGLMQFSFLGGSPVQSPHRQTFLTQHCTSLLLLFYWHDIPETSMSFCQLSPQCACWITQNPLISWWMQLHAVKKAIMDAQLHIRLMGALCAFWYDVHIARLGTQICYRWMISEDDILSAQNSWWMRRLDLRQKQNGILCLACDSQKVLMQKCF